MAQAISPYAAPTPEDEDRARALEWARLTPMERAAMQHRQATLGMQRDIVDIGSGLAGQKSLTERKRLAVREIQELAKTVQPGTPEFYDQAAAIFQKYSLVDEAERMTKAKQDLDNQKLTGEHPIGKLQRLRDRLLARPDKDSPQVKRVIEQIDQAIANEASGKKGSEPALPELAKYKKLRDESTDPKDKAEYQGFIDAIKGAKRDAAAAQTTAEKRAKTAEDREQRQQDAQDQKNADAKEARAKALTALVQGLGLDIARARQLRNHPDLPGLIGYLVGMTEAGQKIAAGVFRNDAYPLFISLRAQTFLHALQSLKAQSKAGNTGLGQLTEVEGAKIQEATAALNPQQGVPAFKDALDNYTTQLVAAYNQGVQELRGAKLPVPPIPALKGGRSSSTTETGRVPTKVPQAAPAPSTVEAPKPAAPKGKRVFKSVIIKD